MTVTAPRRRKPFDLRRRFALASLAAISAIALLYGVLLSNFLTQRLLEREATITMEFVQDVLTGDGSIGYLANQQDANLRERFMGSMVHFALMPEVPRINVYLPDHTVLWSTDKQLIGQRFPANDELDHALKGHPEFESGRISDEQRAKAEHVGLSGRSDYFIETYVPIREKPGGRVLGAFEIYKAPLALTEAIRDGQRQVWLTACLGALVLYVALYWIVRKADQELREQHERLVKAETMAAVGELASSVAHNIRNPLASIRSSAEVALELGASPSTEQARDIMAAVDRIEGWLRDMASFVHVDAGAAALIDASALLQDCFFAAQPAIERAGLQAETSGVEREVPIRADRALLGHVLHSLISNAVEATAPGGRISGEVQRDARHVRLVIRDTGSGIAPEHQQRLFSLFFSTKSRGLGIGLALAHRAVERIGGSIHVASTVGVGKAFTIELPAV